MLHDLRWLLRLAKEANERDGIAAPESVPAPAAEPFIRFAFPASSEPCRVTLDVAPGWRRKSPAVADAVDRAESVASRLGCELLRVVMAPEGACTEEAHGVFWAMAPIGHPDVPADTKGVQRWLDGLAFAESRLLADDATTIAALDALREEGERRLDEVGG